jgi:hypothetical protein
MPSKFEFSKKSVPTKNGKNIETTIIKAKNQNKRILYSELGKFVTKLEENGVNIRKLKIVGGNRLKPFTIKSENEDFDYDYMQNKPANVRNAIDGFYEIHIINFV